MDLKEQADELINKHLYLHGGDGLGITDGDVYRAVLDAVCEALTIPDVSNPVCPIHGTGLYKHPNGMAYCSLCDYSIQWY